MIGKDALTDTPALSLTSLMQFAHELADLSEPEILQYFRRPHVVDDKGSAGRFDPVTVADRAAEQVICAAIGRRFPDHGILGEEFGAAGGESPLRWLIDPIDGTRAFITGMPAWGTLIALVDGAAPILGLINQPFTRERYWAARDGNGAYGRGPDGHVHRLKTRPCTRLDQAVLATTHPDLFASAGELAAFQQLKTRARMTRYGGDCYGYCMLAAGFIDIIVESGLRPYDIAALVPVIEEAGGHITGWRGEPALDGSGRIVAAGDERVHREALTLLQGLP